MSLDCRLKDVESETASAGTDRNQFVSGFKVQLFSDVLSIALLGFLADIAGIDYRNLDVYNTGKGCIQRDDIRIAMNQQGIKIKIEPVECPLLKFLLILFFYKDIPQAADNWAGLMKSCSDSCRNGSSSK